MGSFYANIPDIGFCLKDKYNRSINMGQTVSMHIYLIAKGRNCKNMQDIKRKKDKLRGFMVTIKWGE